MDTPESAYKKFSAALDYYAEKEGWGFQSSLSQMAGVSVSMINQALKGNKRIGFEKQVQIASAFNKTYEEFLAFGRRLMEGDSVNKFPSPTGHPLIVETLNGFDKLVLEQHTDHFRGAPLYETGRLAAFSGGVYFDRNEIPDSTVIVHRKELGHHANRDLIALRVGHRNPNQSGGEKADSMEPTIPRGSIVIVDLGEREPQKNKIYVVRDPREADPENAGLMIKRIQLIKEKDYEGYALMSDNKKRLPIVTRMEWPWLVIGRVVWMWRSLEEA